MEGNTTILTNPADGKELKYKYDKCYWSHSNDGGHTLFTNVDLMQDVGTELLANTYEGFNSTIFAYG